MAVEMNLHKLTIGYTIGVVLLGVGSLTYAILNLPTHKLDLYFLVLAGSTIGLGSWATVKIPRIKTHIAVSDIFIFLTLLLYGGSIAVILAAVEAFFTSWRFCSKKITIFFNVAAMAFSTLVVVFLLAMSGFYLDGEILPNQLPFQSFIISLSI